MRVQPDIAAVSNLLRSLLPIQVNNSSNHIDLAEIHPVWPGPNTKKQKSSLSVCICLCVVGNERVREGYREVVWGVG